MAFEVVVPDVEELREGDPRELVLENARRKARAVDGRAGARGRHRGGARRADLRQAGRRGRGGGLPARALGPRPRGDERARAADGGRERTAVAVTRVRFRALERARDRLVPRHRRVARARRRLRDPGPRRRARGGDRGRLLERGRPAGAGAARACARPALSGAQGAGSGCQFRTASGRRLFVRRTTSLPSGAIV